MTCPRGFQSHVICNCKDPADPTNPAWLWEAPGFDHATTWESAKDRLKFTEPRGPIAFVKLPPPDTDATK